VYLLDVNVVLAAHREARADLIPDAVLVAIAIEHECTIATPDRDFARFPSVRHTLLPR
jgi:uncharacterized protein